MNERIVRCVMCGTESRETTVGYDIVFEPLCAPDLDFRAPPPWRTGAMDWVKECAKCLYAAPRLDVAIPGAASRMRSESFLSVSSGYADGRLFGRLHRSLERWIGGKEPLRMPREARRFLTYALFVEQGDPATAAHARLTAAWACDDRHADAGADHCRTLAVASFAPAGSGADSRVELRNGAIVVDMLRRNGRFADAESACLNLLRRPDLGILIEVVDCQRRLLEERDRSAHTLERAGPEWNAATREAYSAGERYPLSERASLVLPRVPTAIEQTI